MKKYNPSENGKKGLALAIAWLSLRDYLVSIPTLRQGAYDLLIDSGNGKIKKIKVVTCTHKTPYGKYEVNLRITGGYYSTNKTKKHFDNTKVDFLFAICDWKEFYFIPSYEINCKNKLIVENFPTYKFDFFGADS